MALLPDSEAFGHKGRVFDLDFNPLDPACLASASEDGSVRVWRTDAHSSTWRQVRTHCSSRSLPGSPNTTPGGLQVGQHLPCILPQASCCFGHKDEVLRVAWSSDGSTLASGEQCQTAGNSCNYAAASSMLRHVILYSSFLMFVVGPMVGVRMRLVPVLQL
jgi:WD40 repeat protein